MAPKRGNAPAPTENPPPLRASARIKEAADRGTTAVAGAQPAANTTATRPTNASQSAPASKPKDGKKASQPAKSTSSGTAAPRARPAARNRTRLGQQGVLLPVSEEGEEDEEAEDEEDEEEEEEEEDQNQLQGAQQGPTEQERAQRKRQRSDQRRLEVQQLLDLYSQRQAQQRYGQPQPAQQQPAQQQPAQQQPAQQQPTQQQPTQQQPAQQQPAQQQVVQNNPNPRSLTLYELQFQNSFSHLNNNSNARDVSAAWAPLLRRSFPRPKYQVFTEHDRNGTYIIVAKEARWPAEQEVSSNTYKEAKKRRKEEDDEEEEEEEDEGKAGGSPPREPQHKRTRTQKESTGTNPGSKTATKTSNPVATRSNLKFGSIVKPATGKSKATKPTVSKSNPTETSQTSKSAVNRSRVGSNLPTESGELVTSNINTRTGSRSLRSRGRLQEDVGFAAAPTESNREQQEEAGIEARLTAGANAVEALEAQIRASRVNWPVAEESNVRGTVDFDPAISGKFNLVLVLYCGNNGQLESVGGEWQSNPLGSTVQTLLRRIQERSSEESQRRSVFGISALGGAYRFWEHIPEQLFYDDDDRDSTDPPYLPMKPVYRRAYYTEDREENACHKVRSGIDIAKLNAKIALLDPSPILYKYRLEQMDAERDRLTRPSSEPVTFFRFDSSRTRREHAALQNQLGLNKTVEGDPLPSPHSATESDTGPVLGPNRRKATGKKAKGQGAKNKGKGKAIASTAAAAATAAATDEQQSGAAGPTSLNRGAQRGPTEDEDDSEDSPPPEPAGGHKYRAVEGRPGIWRRLR